jgi:hypothetical protein
MLTATCAAAGLDYTTLINTIAALAMARHP